MNKRSRNASRLLIFVLVLLLTVSTGLSVPVFGESNGSGTKAESWYDAEKKSVTISTSAELEEFAAIVNGTAEGIPQDDFSGKTITLAGNIDLKNQPWIPIGTAVNDSNGTFNQSKSTPFNGTFDGAGYTISGLSITDEADGVALFGYAAEKSSIKNLTVSGTVQGGHHVAGIVSVTSGKLEQVVNKVNVSATGSYVGGITSEIYGEDFKLTQCHNEGSVENSTKDKSTGKVGGIVGTIDFGDAKITECSNKGDITGYQYVGGIIGGQFADADISYCYNSGNLKGISFGKVYLGGIAGKSQAGTISDCYNAGDLYDAHWSSGHIRAIGGIAGCEQNRAGGTTAITGCYNIGQIDANTSNMISESGNKYYIYMVGNISGGDSATGANSMKYERCYFLEGRITFADKGHEGYQYWADVYTENPTLWDTKYVESKSDVEMKAAAFIKEIGDAFVQDTKKQNNGYPVLYWQAEGSAKPGAKQYEVQSKVYGDESASIEAPETAGESGTVTFSVKNIPDSKKVYKAEVRDSSGKKIKTVENDGSWTFTMPSRNVTIHVYLENKISGDAAEYQVSKAKTVDGIWDFAFESGYGNGNSFKEGATVVVEVTRNEDAFTTSLAGLKVTSADSDVSVTQYYLKNDIYDNGASGTYAFTMPKGDVTVEPIEEFVEFAVYQQAGEDGTPKLVKSYSREEMLKLADKDVYFSGWSSDKEGFIGKAVYGVGLQNLLKDAGLADKVGTSTSFKVTAMDGMSLSYSYDKLYGSDRYYYPNLISGKSATEKESGKTKIDAMFMIKGYMATESDGDIEKQDYDTAFAYRFVYGQTAKEFNNGNPSVDYIAGSYMPKSNVSIVVVTEEGNHTSWDNAWDGSVDISWYLGHEKDKEYQISSAAQLAGVAAIVNGHVDVSNLDASYGGNGKGILIGKDGKQISLKDFPTTENYWTSIDDMNGKTIILEADLDMGGVYNKTTKTWSGPNYMPIGGQWCVEKSNPETALSTSFNGVFDGNGHEIINIYCDRYIDPTEGYDMIYKYSQSIGLIGRLGCHDNDSESIWADNPGVKNVSVDGYIKGRRSVGGVVGKIGKTKKGALIENCVNHATVQGTDKKGTGGIVGTAWNGGMVKNCYNTGSIRNSMAAVTGGIVGTNEIKVINCYNVGNVKAATDSYAMSLGTNDGGRFINCYWLSGTAKGGGVYNETDKDSVTKVSGSKMIKEAFLKDLNGTGRAFVADKKNINGGYPALRWQYEDNSSFVGMKVKGTPEKTEYIEGEAFDTTGLEFWATYDDGTEELIENLSVTPSTLAIDTKTVTVKCEYKGQTKTVNCDVSVGNKEVEFIKVTSLPATTIYEQGQRFDSTGMKVTVKYSNGHSEVIKDYVVKDQSGNILESDTILQKGTSQLEIFYTYRGKTVSDTIRIFVMDKLPSKNTNGAYQLSTEEDMIWFQEVVNGGKTDIDVILMDDIKLTKEWIPVGYVGNAYTGTFDGNGKSITNMEIKGDANSVYNALFAVTDNAVIKDFVLKGDVSGKNTLAGVVAEAYQTNISGIDADVYVVGTNSLGGIVAVNLGGTIENCINRGTVSGNDYLGGIASKNIDADGKVGMIENCINHGSIVCESNSGLIVGYQGGSAQMCLSTGEIAGGSGETPENFGSIFGVLYAEKGSSNTDLFYCNEKISSIGDAQKGNAESGLLPDDSLKELGYEAKKLTVAMFKEVISRTRNLMNADMQLSENSYTYNGKARMPEVTVTLNGVTLQNRVDYTVTYESNIYPGTANVIVNGTGKYQGTLSKAFTVKAPKIAAQKTVTGSLYKEYNTVRVKWSTQKVAGASVKYKVEYRKESGKWVTLKSNTSGSYTTKTKLTPGAKYTFRVTPYTVINGKTYAGTAKVSNATYTLKKLSTPTVKKVSSKTVKISWKKINSATGYKVYRSTKQSSGYKCIATVKTVSTRINATKGTKYYYKVRAYCKIGSQYVYGPYSNTSKVFRLK